MSLSNNEDYNSDKELESRDDSLLEKQAENESKKHECGVCSQEFQSPDKLCLHLIKHVFEFRCETCHRVFKDRASFNTHSSAHQKQMIKIEVLQSGVKCYDCPRGEQSNSDVTKTESISGNEDSEITYQSQLTDYFVTENNGDNNFVCEICKQDFVSYNLLHLHQQIHSGENCPYQCPDCDVILVNKTAYMAHMKSHADGVCCVCPLCHQEFMDKGSFGKHHCAQMDKVTAQKAVSVSFVENFVVYKKEPSNDEPEEEKESIGSCKRKQLKTYKDGISLKEAQLERNIYRNKRILKSITNGKKPYKCTECGLEFKSRSLFRQHKKIHNAQREEEHYRCWICGKAFKGKVTLINHVKCHEGHKEDEHHKCPVCQQPFKVMTLLLKHIEKYHAGEDLGDFLKIAPNIKSIKDSSTTVKVPSSLKLTDSNSNSAPLEGNPNVCSICHKVLSRAKDMGRHMKTHTGEKHQCNICGKYFARLDGLMLHKRTYHPSAFTLKTVKLEDDENEENLSRPVSCELCNVVCENKANLRQHMFMIHSIGKSEKSIIILKENDTDESVGNQPFSGVSSNTRRKLLPKQYKTKPTVCKVCNAVLKNRKSLMGHMRTHSKMRYNCDFCDKTFARIYVLQYHLRVFHSKVLVNAKEGYPGQLFKSSITRKLLFKCPVCGFLFIHHSELTTHLKIHSGDLPYECVACAIKFNAREKLQEHLKIHRRKDLVVRYRCSYCNKPFFKKCDFDRHANVHSGNKPYQCTQCGLTFGRKDALGTHWKRKHCT